VSDHPWKRQSLSGNSGTTMPLAFEALSRTRRTIPDFSIRPFLKTGHSTFQNRPLGVELGQHRTLTGLDSAD
jgi:hypothetical protein